MIQKYVALTIAIFYFQCLSAQPNHNPTFEEVISLPSISSAVISPNGKHVIFQKQTADWKENRYDRELWLSKDGQNPFPLTNNLEGNSSSPKWSPNGRWIAFLSKRAEKTQIQMINVSGGESFQFTNTEQDISGFEWAPDGNRIAFTQQENNSEKKEEREEKYGAFAEDDAEFNLGQLWLIDFDEDRLSENLLPAQLDDSILTQKLKAQIVMDSVDFSISGIKWSPDGTKIAFDHQPDPLINSFFKSDISIYDLESKSHYALVANSSFDGLLDWSPDGDQILYASHLQDTSSNYYRNGNLFRINIDGSNNVRLAGDFDEGISSIQWTPLGIFGVAWQKTVRHMVEIDPDGGDTKIIRTEPARIYSHSYSEDGSKVAFTGANDNDLTEVYLGVVKGAASKLTNATERLEGWKVAQSEMIEWESEDGSVIEGVLHKPFDYDPQKKYPLMVVVHGGPTGISTPSAAPSYVYPMLQWLNKGALILRPNYRGSAGYGEAFRSLNVENLGVGDAWDVLSGVQYLEEQGIIDTEKVACMGWSQGGYISAFLTTNSDKFQAISVGAGISNWMTYYVNTDIHPFTRQYLKATPWSNKDIYEKTSPMTNINNASTPTLIQHGEFDQRVPVANAYELHQGLQDVGVKSKLIIYKGFGHGITKPKERLAATWHNWQWFGKYVWGEDIDME